MNVISRIQISSPEDSGNISYASLNCPIEFPDVLETATRAGGNKQAFTCYTDRNIVIATKNDCQNTVYANKNSSWFYFTARVPEPQTIIRFTICNMNVQGRLYGQGYSPVIAVEDSSQVLSAWVRSLSPCAWFVLDRKFYLTFIHKLDSPDLRYHFAFAFPWNYRQCVQQLTGLQTSFMEQPPLTDIYFHRELLCYSLEGRRVELITITDFNGMEEEKELVFDPWLFPEKDRCRRFRSKKIFFVSARVHPGETQSSHVFNGFLEFLLRDCDPRARLLRSKFVFKLVPMLNPDGVFHGHYRTDLRGVNLNRVYLEPHPILHSPVYAVKSLIAYHHMGREKHLMSLYTGKKLEADLLNALCITVRKLLLKNANSRLNKSQFRQLIKHLVEPIDDACRKSQPALYAEAKNTLTRLEDDEHMDALVDKIRCSLKTQLMAGHLQEDGSSDTEDEVGDREGEREETERLRGSTREALFADVLSVVVDHLPEYQAFSKLASGAHLTGEAYRQRSARESGVAFYIDLHGHCTKRGCFLFGNSLDSEVDMTRNLLFAQLMAHNSPFFELEACNFSLKNMFSRDRNSRSSKAGTGRVAMLTEYGIVHSYTLECNYNTISKLMPRALPDAVNPEAQGRITPGNSVVSVSRSPLIVGCMKAAPSDEFRLLTRSQRVWHQRLLTATGVVRFLPAHFEAMGRTLAYSALDLLVMNPWSRLVYPNEVIKKLWPATASSSGELPPTLKRRVSDITVHQLRIASDKRTTILQLINKCADQASSMTKTKSSTNTNNNNGTFRQSNRNQAKRVDTQSISENLLVQEESCRAVSQSAAKAPFTGIGGTGPLANKSSTNNCSWSRAKKKPARGTRKASYAEKA